MPFEYKTSSGSTRSSKARNEAVMVKASEVRRLRFGREAEMPLERKTLSASTKRSKPKSETVRLTASEASRLIGICIELIDICSKVTGKIDPAVGTVVAFARDEALAEALEISS